MAFLIVSGITVGVASAQREEDVAGDSARAFDLTFRMTVTARKENWAITTKPLSRTASDALESALKSTTQPLVCSGDLLGGTVNCCCVSVASWEATKKPADHRVVLGFTLCEE